MNTAARLIGGSDAAAIRPFEVKIPERDLADMRRRIEASRFSERETVTDFSQGVPLATIQKLAQYWATEYDWRRVEARLNAAPNFITGIDGLDIHFIHARSKHENALPIVITHGWPGSIVWYLKVIEPLTNPTAYGGKASDAFHVVIPSMPGYGFSGKPTATGWGPARIAHAWSTLMERLGYERYVAQGGDWGAIVTDLMGAEAPKGLLGIHTNMPCVVPTEYDKLLWSGGPVPGGLPEEERRACEQLISVFRHISYALFMGSRPQTLAALADSPVGLATFLLDLEPDAHGLELRCRAFDGKRESLTRDDILDNATLYWLTNTGVSAARLYWENKLNFFAPKNVDIPVAVSVFPNELYQAPRSWAEKAYPKLMHYNRLDKGGHVPAWEQPELFVDELRTGFRSLRPV